MNVVDDNPGQAKQRPGESSLLRRVDNAASNIIARLGKVEADNAEFRSTLKEVRSTLKEVEADNAEFRSTLKEVEADNAKFRSMKREEELVTYIHSVYGIMPLMFEAFKEGLEVMGIQRKYPMVSQDLITKLAGIQDWVSFERLWHKVEGNEPARVMLRTLGNEFASKLGIPRGFWTGAQAVKSMNQGRNRKQHPSDLNVVAGQLLNALTANELLDVEGWEEGQVMLKALATCVPTFGPKLKAAQRNVAEQWQRGRAEAEKEDRKNSTALLAP